MQFTKRPAVIAGAASAVICLGLYIFLFSPILVKLGRAYVRYVELNNEINDMRNLMDAVKKFELRNPLANEETVSVAIGELTQRGMEAGVEFSSINSGDVRVEKALNCKCLPLAIKLESDVKAISAFMGVLDNLEKSLVKVKSFNIRRKGDDPSRLETDLSVDMYFSGEE